MKEIKAVYFVGIGGIGMSAIARYFLHRGIIVAGYDRTATPLTHQLEAEGAVLHYDEDITAIPEACKDSATTLVVYTPAVPSDHAELVFFRKHHFNVLKRAEVLGILTNTLRGLCVAGTHGKTTTSTMCAHILHQSSIDCNAFLGGISKNYGTNYILSDSNYVVIEADEFDRSFHHLKPFMSVVTATDPDHLDIYGNKEDYLESFAHYTSLIQDGGTLIIHRGLELKERIGRGVRRYDYSEGEGDFHAANIRIGGGTIVFDLVSPIEGIHDIELGHPLRINIENGIAAMAMAQLCGVTAHEIRAAMKSYAGVERRFDFKIRRDDLVFLSDYAHHPEEIRQSARSIKQLYEGRQVTAIFQPHLYTRTRDFYREFAAALSEFDRVVLCDLYPAREKPIQGVSSALIYDNLKPGIDRSLIKKAEVLNYVRNHSFDILVVLGAGDLDDLCPQIEEILK